MASGLGAGLKYRVNPEGFDVIFWIISSSSEDGADDSAEESESAMIVEVMPDCAIIWAGAKLCVGRCKAGECEANVQCSGSGLKRN